VKTCKFFIYGSALLFVPAFFIVSIRAEIISPDRRIDWSQPGVPGGIPHRTIIYKTISAETYGNGSTDAAPAIQAVLDACPDNQVVLLSAGKYKIMGNLKLGSPVTLRGEGQGRTILSFEGGGRSGLVMDASVYYQISTIKNIVSLTGGLTKGSATLKVSGTTNMNVGDLLHVDQLNDGVLTDPNGVEGICTYCSRDSGTRTLGQIVKITAVDAATKTVVIHKPLNFTYTDSLLPQAVVIPAKNYVDRAGVEDLTVTQPSALYTYLVEMQGVQNCWLRNVEIENVDWRAIWLIYGLQNEIRECYMHHSKNGYGRSHGYGIFVDLLSTANLIEDNVFTTIDGGGIMTGGGATGNVLAYNIIADPCFDDVWWATGSPCLNHNPHPMMNLWEGNRGDKFEGDFIHGSSSHNTIFRSYARGWTKDSATSANAAVALAKKNTYYNVVGCVLGTAGKSNKYEVTAGQTWNSEDMAIWLLGVTCEVEGPDVLPTLFRHGNFDYVTNSVKWDPTVSDRTLPASLYLQNAPFFMEKVPWPPIGPDVSGYYNKIPAELWLGQLKSTKTNTPPVAAPVEVSTGVTKAVVIKPGATDAEGDYLRFFVVNDGGPAHGTLAWTADGLTYMPAEGYIGADSFSVAASDARAFSNSAKIKISIRNSAVVSARRRTGAKPLIIVFNGTAIAMDMPELPKDANLSLFNTQGERVALWSSVGDKRVFKCPANRPNGLYIVKSFSGPRTHAARLLLTK
jgi:hypothetical protein